MPWSPRVPPGCLLGASWVPPRVPLGASWMIPGCLLGASRVPSGCFLGVSWVLPCRANREPLFGVARWGHIYIYIYTYIYIYIYIKIYIQILFVFRSKNQHGYACRGCVIFEMRACENRSYFFVKKKCLTYSFAFHHRSQSMPKHTPTSTKAHPNHYQSTPQPVPKHSPIITNH